MYHIPALPATAFSLWKNDGYYCVLARATLSADDFDKKLDELYKNLYKWKH